MLTHLYITSSWDCWQYGGSYGQRSFVDIYVFYSIFMGATLSKLKSIPLKDVDGHIQGSLFHLFIPALVICVLLNVKFMLAYWHGILPFSDATMENILNVMDWNLIEMRNLITGK